VGCKILAQSTIMESTLIRVLILRMVLDNGLLKVLTVYASRSGKPEEEKESFGDEVFIW